jgi:Ca-activated chloride channel family protein
MMLWREATALWGLLAVVFLGVFLFWTQRRRRRVLQAFAETALLPRLAPAVAPRRRALRDGIRLGALAACVVALAGPRFGFQWEEVRRHGVDLVIALDTSKSMLAVDVKPNRLERAKLGVLDLLRLLAGDRVALVPFAGTAFLQCPLTLDYDAFAQSLMAVDAGSIPRGGTSVARAIDVGVEAFAGREGAHGALILITDGESHEGDIDASLARAKEAGVRIFSVGIGTVEGELIPLADTGGGPGFLKDREGRVVKTRLDETTLQRIADETGGAYVRGSGGSLGLDELFREHIAPMTRREVESTIERRHEDRFQVPLVIALLLLATEVLMADRGVAWRLRARLPRWRSRGGAPVAAGGGAEGVT